MLRWVAGHIEAALGVGFVKLIACHLEGATMFARPRAYA